MVSRDGGLRVCGGDGDVSEGVRRQNTDLRPVWKGTPTRVGEAWCAGGLGFRQNWSRVRTKNEGDLGLKLGNVATFRATSRRSREDIFQRCDVPKRKVFQRRDVRSNVATFQGMLKINVATLDINVATFQRHSKSTSRR